MELKNGKQKSYKKRFVKPQKLSVSYSEFVFARKLSYQFISCTEWQVEIKRSEQIQFPVELRVSSFSYNK